MNTVRLIIGLVILLVVAAIAVFNMHPENDVLIRLASGEVRTTAGVLILIAWGAGVISYLIFALLGEIRLRTRLALREARDRTADARTERPAQFAGER